MLGTAKDSQPETKKRTKKDSDDDDDRKDDSKKLKELKSEQKLPRLSEMTVPTVAELHRAARRLAGGPGGEQG